MFAGRFDLFPTYAAYHLRPKEDANAPLVSWTAAWLVFVAQELTVIPVCGTFCSPTYKDQKVRRGSSRILGAAVN